MCDVSPNVPMRISSMPFRKPGAGHSSVSIGVTGPKGHPTLRCLLKTLQRHVPLHRFVHPVRRESSDDGIRQTEAAIEQKNRIVRRILNERRLKNLMEKYSVVNVPSGSERKHPNASAAAPATPAAPVAPAISAIPAAPAAPATTVAPVAPDIKSPDTAPTASSLGYRD
ncbi:hypothetical protein B0O80DRAFT_490113 [Mortierella sp. GBAus27b]|nr:hypothetical protein B0O80DRAFT_490113 [Mortierella sp. GBAus27b]